MPLEHQLLFLILGVVWGGLFLWYARSKGATNERLLLASGLVIAAVIYIGFGLVWGNVYWVGIESAGVVFYTLFVILAYQHKYWWLAIGWLLHVCWDIGLHLMGPGVHIVPAWYAVACIGFDVLMAGYILFGLQKTTPTSSVSHMSRETVQ